MVFLNEPPPEGMINNDIPLTTKQSYSSDNTLWFGAAGEAPEGEILQSSSWIYALAAPFPTILDDISMAALNLLWFGQPEANTPPITASKLYVPESIGQVLEREWGYRDQQTIIFVENIPDPETLWEENAWAIIPFDALTPKLKVISIDGYSPLFKDFESETYPLNIEYQLINNKSINGQIDADDMQTVINAIETTNRDPEKMTTLIMTGVTALVRATAYRMEINGVHYPGEKIGHWLREADITHISNEVSFYEDCPFPDPHNRMLFFCSNPDYIDLFEFVGADIIELTGNHNNDTLYVYGEDVVPFTLDLYEQYKMKTYGGGRNLEEAMSPAVMTHNGNQVAFIGCNAPGPDFAWATENQGGAAPCGDYQWMIDEIGLLREQGILPIATLQYYEDYYNYAETHHIRDFNPLAEAGAVIVNGSQAHRPKGMAFVGESFIDYGLGNLFFDQMGVTIDGKNIQQTSWEVIQRHTIYDNRLLSTELLTAKLVDYAQPRPMTVRERAIFLEELFNASGWNSR
jgi:poly-gamma-glutamate synthesis protein (capsule biosynthesis protein)